jgi:autotransporter-associated beta strand protein
MLLDSLFRYLDFHGTGPRAKRSRDASVRPGRNRARRASATRYQPRLEALEQRLAPAVHLWIAASDGSWSNPFNWRNDDGRSPYADSSAWLKFGDPPLVHDTIHDFGGPTTMATIELYSDQGFITGYSLSAAPGAGVITLTHDLRSDAHGGTNTISLPLYFSDAPHEFNVLASDTLVLSGSGNLSGLSGPGFIRKLGTGTLVMSGDHTTFQGRIEVAAGTLLVGSNNGVGIDEPITVDQQGVLDLNNHNETLQLDVSDGEIRLGSGNLTLMNGNGYGDHISGDINGTGGLTVSGNTTTVFLTGRQNYTGETRLLSGRLWVNGSSAASPITVSPGAHLYGRGTTGPLSVSGSVQPGDGQNGRGVLHTNGDVNFQPGSSFYADILGLDPGDGYDQLNVSGRVDLSHSPTLHATLSFNSHPGDSFTILTSTDGITGTFAGLPDGTNFGLGGTPMQIHYTGTSVVLTHLPQFFPPVYYPANAPDSVAVGDFNGDGIPDLAVGIFANDGHNAYVNLLLGNGDGTFRNIAPIALPYGSYPLSVAVGHFQDPNILDLAVTTYDHKVYVVLGNGDGTFQMPVAYNVGAYPNSLVVGDLNGDGNQDLVLVNRESRTVSILYGNGDGTFQDAVNVDFPGYNAVSAAALADVSHDGKLDLVVAIWSPGAGGIVRVLHNDGNDQDGHTVFRNTSADDYRTGGDGISSLALADLGDGHLDVIAGNYFRVDVLTGNGDGTFQRTVKTTAVPDSTGESVVVADFDGDGKPDVAVIASYGTSHALALLYGKGDGYFQAPGYYDLGGGRANSLAVGDFNHDGHPDLAATIYEGNVGILINRGDAPPPPALPGHGDLSLSIAQSPSDTFLLTSGTRPALEPARTAPDTPTSLIPSRRPSPVLDDAGVERFFANATEQDLDPAWPRLHSSSEAWLASDDAGWTGIWQEN